MIAERLIRIIDWLYIKPIERVVSRDTFGYGLCGAANMMLDTLWYFIIYHYIVAERFIEDRKSVV